MSPPVKRLAQKNGATERRTTILTKCLWFAKWSEFGRLVTNRAGKIKILIKNQNRVAQSTLARVAHLKYRTTTTSTIEKRLFCQPIGVQPYARLPVSVDCRWTSVFTRIESIPRVSLVVQAYVIKTSFFRANNHLASILPSFHTKYQSLHRLCFSVFSVSVICIVCAMSARKRTLLKVIILGDSG